MPQSELVSADDDLVFRHGAADFFQNGIFDVYEIVVIRRFDKRIFLAVIIKIRIFREPFQIERKPGDFGEMLLVIELPEFADCLEKAFVAAHTVTPPI